MSGALRRQQFEQDRGAQLRRRRQAGAERVVLVDRGAAGNAGKEVSGREQAVGESPASPRHAVRLEGVEHALANQA